MSDSLRRMPAPAANAAPKTSTLLQLSDVLGAQLRQLALITRDREDPQQARERVSQLYRTHLRLQSAVLRRD